ncbi:MAG TPA: isoprenylcysteine carboxylmethyltransferase family protein [Candidatus Binatia bacterium]|nr:isoprenylcysteine carboxylmethyltransferase family protein [Candidatus Binatia bacterium]
MRGILATIRRWNIAIGSFFFGYRNALFPVVFLLAAAVLRPQILLGSPGLNRLLIILGVGFAVFGQSFRLMTIGWEYIHRGGKDGTVYAQRLVQRGMYGITRNPMYVGNSLIAIGMTLATCSPVAYGLIIPFFLFVYHAIVSVEEHYLRNKFGAEHEAYCARVNRFIPSVRLIPEAFSGMRYNGGFALRRDLSTIAGLIIGFIILPVWRTYFLEGLPEAQTVAVRAVVLSSAVGLVYAPLLYLKRHKRLFHEAGDRSSIKVNIRLRAARSLSCLSWGGTVIRRKLRDYHRYLAYPVIILPLLLFSPTFVKSDHMMDEFLDIFGVAIACGGEALRIWTRGTNRKAPGVRTFGPYRFIRYPLYVGNFLIALGLLIVFNAPAAYLIILPFLAFVYSSVAQEKEDRLEKKWGAAYIAYRAKVPRFVPWFGRFLKEGQSSAFDLWQALHKEGKSVCGLLAGALILEAYEDFLTFGVQQMREEIFILLLSLLLGLLSFYLYLSGTSKMEKA